MDAANRRTRIIRALLEGVCKEHIAGREHISMSQLYRIAKAEGIHPCNHRYDVCLGESTGMTVLSISMTDKERIDWVEGSRLSVVSHRERSGDEGFYEIWWTVRDIRNNQITHPNTSWRAAVDGARKAIDEKVTLSSRRLVERE